MKVATRSFRAMYDGQEVEVLEGERVTDDHAIFAAHPENFRHRGLDEELQIRSARVAELNDRARTTNEPLTDRARREREEESFWERTVRLLDTKTEQDRRERQDATTALDAIEAYDAGIVRAERERLLEHWDGRLQTGRVAG